MQLKNLTFFILMLCFVGNISAQRKKNSNNKVEIIEFGEDGETLSGNSKITDLVVKTSPTSYLLGSQFLELEKYVTDYLSIQGGLGLTFRPVIGGTFEEYIESELDEDGGRECDSEIWGQYDICDKYTDYSIRQFKPGLLISGSARLFFDDDAMDGGYFAIKLRYSKLNLQVQDIIQNASTVERLENIYTPESVKRFDLVGHYGYQTLHTKLVSEYFLGLGVRFRNETRQDIGQTPSGFIQSTNRSFKRTGVRIEAGIRIGFQL